ncbi:hypothetical protein CPC08DRAFT_719874 [Agrocybe pediades]|nr:hypothetical protein CPC08DRAFT_719874 [Agrocybe pediades]
MPKQRKSHQIHRIIIMARRGQRNRCRESDRDCGVHRENVLKYIYISKYAWNLDGTGLMDAPTPGRTCLMVSVGEGGSWRSLLAESVPKWNLKDTRRAKTKTQAQNHNSAAFAFITDAADPSESRHWTRFFTAIVVRPSGWRKAELWQDISVKDQVNFEESCTANGAHLSSKLLT